MNDALTVSAFEHRRIRVFQLDIDDGEIAAIKDPAPDTAPTAAAVAQLLGLDWLNPDFFEIFPVEDLDGLGLAGYLVQGNGVCQAEVAPSLAQLNAVTGQVLIVYSSSFAGKAVTLCPTRQLRLIGAYGEPSTEVKFTALPEAAAQGILAGSPGSLAQARNPHFTLMAALLALPVLALILGVLFFGVMR